jgi:hypothetical protein
MSIPNAIQSSPEVSEVLATNVKTWLSSTSTDLPEDTPRNRTRTRRASLCQPFPSPPAITEEHEEDPLEMHVKNQDSRTLGHLELMGALLMVTRQEKMVLGLPKGRSYEVVSSRILEMPCLVYYLTF